MINLVHGSRAALIRGGSGSDDSSGSTSIRLNNIKESIWWAAFADREYESQALGSLRTSIELHELLFVLGAEQDDDATTVQLSAGLHLEG